MGSLPGISALTQSTEAIIVWGGNQSRVLYDMDCVLGSAAVDAGSTPTTVLRPGLILGRKTSDKLLYQYDPTATDGTEVPVGVLLNGLSMLDYTGAAEKKDAGAMGVVVAAAVKAANLTIKGTALVGHTYEYVARMLMKAFTFDDDRPGLFQDSSFSRQYAKTANYTVVAADTGKNFNNAGAAGEVDFTLPAIQPGLAFYFRGVVDQILKVISAEGTNVVALNNASASSVAFSTASQKIGGGFFVRSNQDGTKWLVENASAGTNTITVA